ncbi:MAG: hypothetical protein M3O87_04980, partial [Candidatus Dormibacteraeota bacterium]|nr:hypothetical protein [Candidatus Dormibacteraeota bacterium]
MRVRRIITALFAAAAVAIMVPGVALAATAGDDNKGDVWVDNVGQPAGPGHEMDPHLKCQDINLWGSALADAGGTYTVDGWEPSGSGDGDQAWP